MMLTDFIYLIGFVLALAGLYLLDGVIKEL